jgi:hypothetical protein
MYWLKAKNQDIMGAKNMKKWSMALVLLFCVTGLFGQDFFNLVQMGTPEQVQAAIKAGAKIDDRNQVGQTPLIYAAWFNENPAVITTLLNAGAKLDDRDKDGTTPLMWAGWLKASRYHHNLAECRC